MTPQEIISDEEIAHVHGNANFGAMDPREVVNDGVRKTAVGYHCGSTQLHILRDHGLVTKPRAGSSATDLTKKGKAYARSIYRDTTPARAEAQSDDLRTACQAVLDDYQTSDAHHPDHVLIRRTDFERIKVLVEAPVVVQAARDLVRQAHEILRSGNPPFSAREVNARGKLRDALNPDRARAEAQDEGAAK